MNEQWNSALDQVEDAFLMEAVSYRRKPHWPKVAAAVAAVLVLTVGWSIVKPQPQPAPPEMSDGTPDRGSVPMADSPESCPPGDVAYGGLWDSLLSGIKGDSGSTEAVEDEPDATKTLHYSSYQELQTACLNEHEWFLHRDVMVPYLGDQLLGSEDIAVFEAEMYDEPWVWYFLSNDPHITLRVPTMPDLTADIAADVSGAEALKQIWPDAPNLHNREYHAAAYSEIREVELVTSEGVKTALYRQEAQRDRAYWTFLQNGTLVTIAGPQNALEGNWLESFRLAPIDSLS